MDDKTLISELHHHIKGVTLPEKFAMLVCCLRSQIGKLDENITVEKDF